MKLRRMMGLLLAFFMLLSLCGCDLFTVETDTLLSPTRPSGDMFYINRAIDQSTKSEYTLKYPASGEHRTAITLVDLDGDGKNEAVAFYSTQDDEQTKIHINVIKGSGKKWKSISEQSLVAGGIESVVFSDLNDDSVKEIVVGWEIYGGSEKQLAVYSLSKGVLLQRMLERYTGFVCCDLDQNGRQEIFINHLIPNTNEGVNRAKLFSLTDSGVAQIADCMLDGNIKTAQPPVVNELSGGKPAIYIDGIKGIGSVTEVLFLNGGRLVNPLLEGEIVPENTKTLRAASIFAKDINGDRILEIPIASDLPSADGSGEKIYYTNWCAFSGEQLITRLVTITNTLDGYYITPPPSWVGNIAVSKNIADHERTIYSLDSASGEIGLMLARFKAVERKDYKKQDYPTWTELDRNDSYVFVGMLGESAARTISKNELKSMFKVYE